MSEVQYSEAMDKRGEKASIQNIEYMLKCFQSIFVPQFRSFKLKPEADDRGPIFGGNGQKGKEEERPGRVSPIR